MYKLRKGVVIPLHNRKGAKEDIVSEDTTEFEEYLSISDEFFINMSHEIRTPLNVISAVTQLLEMSITADEDNKEVIKGVDYIKKNCYRLTRITNNILDVYEINNGNLKLNVSEADIVETIGNIVQDSTSMAEEMGLKIFFNSNIDKKIMVFDKFKIKKVFLNLISNAIKFSNPKGYIIVNVINKDKGIEISVKDNGIGIDKDNLNSIFKRFGQVDKTLSRKSEGMGVGLFIVKSIVEMHGGNLTVNSEVGMGSEFIVRIPDKLYHDYNNNDAELIQEMETDLVNIEFSDIYNKL